MRIITWRHYVWYALALAVLCCLLWWYVPIFRVESSSMDPTIPTGSYVLVNRLAYLFSSPRRGDMVLFAPTPEAFGNGFWVHRIVAIAGDTVAVRDKRMYVNGDLYPYEIYSADWEQTVPEGKVFQRGDNRYSIMGMIPLNAVVGKVAAVLWRGAGEK